MPLNIPADGFEAGDLKVTYQASDHGKWLKCTDGRTVSRTTYATLFAAVGTTYGPGDGSTTFGLPSPEGRALSIAGSGSGLTVRSVDDTVGTENQPLLEANLPSNVTLNSPSNTGDVNNGVTGPVTIVGVSGSSRGPRSLNVNLGSGSSHNNMQPSYFAGNLFIFAG